MTVDGAIVMFVAIMAFIAGVSVGVLIASDDCYNRPTLEHQFHE